MSLTDYKFQVKDLLKSNSYNTKDLSLELIKAGNNNKVFIIKDSNGSSYLAKFYFSSKEDHRDRLKNEFNFLEFASECGLNCVPKPILKSDKANLGIYQFLEGNEFKKSNLTEERVFFAAKFFCDLNKNKNNKYAKKISYASEAFINPREYMRNIDQKLECLKDATSIKNRKQAHNFLLEIEKFWCSKKKQVSLQKNLEISNDFLCLSPSDFGFHNSIVNQKGEVYFVDFEYAGWDDTAKFLGDFFTQPEISVPKKYLDKFASIALSFSPEKDMLLSRALKLFSIFQIKWCCILLNEFLPNIAMRRKFSNPQIDIEYSRTIQLEKAKKLFSEVT